MALGDFVKKIFVKIQVNGAEEAKAQLTEIDALTKRLKDGVKIPVKVQGDMRTLASQFHALAASTNDARVRTRALRSELDALKKAGDDLGGGGGLIDKLLRWVTGGTGQGAFSRLWGLIGNFKLPLPGPLPNLSGAGGLATLTAALAGLPFLAQAASGAIVLGLGGAMTALGVYAESGKRSVQYQFAQLVSGKDGINATLKNISPAFGEALTTILSAARTFLPQFIRDFGPALDAIAGPLKSLGVMLAGTLANPQVAASIAAVGRAFGSILKALTPQLPGDINSVANGITRVANAITKNPKAIADFISGLIHLVGILLDVIAWLTQVADYLEMHFIPAWHRTQKFLEKWRHDVAKTFIDMWHHTTNVFDGLRHDVAHDWDMLWNNTIGRIQRGVHDVETWFDTLKNKITQKVSHYSTLLVQAGKDLLTGLKNGINDMLPGLLSYVEGVGSSILAHIKSALGIKSPSQVTYYHGQMVAQGLALGMDSGRSQVTAAAMRLAHSAVPGSPMTAYGVNPGGVLRLEVIGGGGGALDRLFIAWLKNYVRVAGGGGPQSVQRALGQVWR